MTLKTRNGFVYHTIAVLIKIMDNINDDYKRKTMKKPLEGHTFFVTRSLDDYTNTAALIMRMGGEPVRCPMISFGIVTEDNTALDESIHNIQRYDWVFFASMNSVQFFSQRIRDLKYDISVLYPLKCAMIGQITKKRANQFGIPCDFIPSDANAEAFMDEFKEKFEVEGKSFLIPSSQIAYDILPNRLLELGGKVDQVVAYQTVHERDFKSTVISLLQEQKPYWVLFTSSSTVDAFMTCLQKVDKMSATLLFASIGPSTSATLRQHGCEPTVEAAEHNMEGLLDSIAEYILKCKESETWQNGWNLL